MISQNVVRYVLMLIKKFNRSNRDFKMQALLRRPEVYPLNPSDCACLRWEFTPYSCHLLRQNRPVPVVVSTSEFAVILCLKSQLFEFFLAIKLISFLYELINHS